MGTIKILIKKELSIHFNSWSIYIGYIVFFCICGFYTWFSGNNLFYIGQATMMPVFIIINWTQFFFIPALTMRAIAEEKRNGTIELMLTKPIKTSELLSGKFLSNLIITMIAPPPDNTLLHHDFHVGSSRPRCRIPRIFRPHLYECLLHQYWYIFVGTIPDCHNCLLH